MGHYGSLGIRIHKFCALYIIHNIYFNLIMSGKAFMMVDFFNFVRM
jgi:hypothetical protein